MGYVEEDWFDTVEIRRASTDKTWCIKNIETVKDVFRDIDLHEFLYIKGVGKLQVETISIQRDRRKILLWVTMWLDSESISLREWAKDDGKNKSQNG